MTSELIGVMAALAAALCWTLASGLWRRLPTSLGSGQLNLLKNLVALALQLPLLLVLVGVGAAGSGGAGPVVLLLLSGVVGIALGDSFYLAALRRLGTRRALTFDAAGPALSAIFAALLLAEVPAPRQWLGIALISLAVLLVATQAPPQSPTTAPAPTGVPGATGSPGASGATGAEDSRLHGQRGLGIALALAAVGCGVAAALLSRAALRQGQFSPLLSATLRLGAAALVMLPMVWRLPAPARRPLPPRRRWACCPQDRCWPCPWRPWRETGQVRWAWRRRCWRWWASPWWRSEPACPRPVAPGSVAGRSGSAH